MKRKAYKVAVVQAAPVFLNLEKSIEKAISLIEEAASKGAALIGFPETWLPGIHYGLDWTRPRGACSLCKGILRIL